MPEINLIDSVVSDVLVRTGHMATLVIAIVFFQHGSSCPGSHRKSFLSPIPARQIHISGTVHGDRLPGAKTLTFWRSRGSGKATAL